MTDDLSSKGETRFTPGPWKVRGVEVVIPDGPFNSCAYAGTRANANLMAAAPALYEALDIICREFAQQHPLIKAGRSALSLARGQTPGDTSNG